MPSSKYTRQYCRAEVTGEVSPELLAHLCESDIRYGDEADTELAMEIEQRLQQNGYSVGAVDGVGAMGD